PVFSLHPSSCFVFNGWGCVHLIPPELNLPWSFQPTKDCRVVFYRPSLSFPPTINMVQIKKVSFWDYATSSNYKEECYFLYFSW
ncbi:hypothetical protein ACFDWB_005293, partial [Salmonella enterica]